MTRFLLGQLILVLTLILAIAMVGGRATTWLHPATWAFVLVIIVPLIAAMSAHNFVTLKQAFRDAANPDGNSSSNSASIRMWRLVESCVYFGGVIGFFMGLIITFTFLSSDLHSLGFKFAATLVPPFYSVVLGLSCRVLRTRVEDAC